MDSNVYYLVEEAQVGHFNLIFLKMKMRFPEREHFDD
ncbi:MAG: hypothetical protein RLZZ248_165 [Bacteroidota bacterium]